MTSRSTILRAIAVLLCLLFFMIPLSAEESEEKKPPTPPSMAEAEAAYLYHLSLEMPVFAKNETSVLPAGSSVKVLAGLILCEELGDRTIETVSVTKEMLADAAGYRLDLKGGEVLTVEQLLYAAICGSYNDAFCVLACFLDGSVSAFAERMNRRATELGATQSLFTEPCGTDDTSKTSAVDQFLIARAAHQNALYMQICGAAKYSLPNDLNLKVSVIRNRNSLISSITTTQYYNGNCNGMSAGGTDKGGNCVLTSATIGGEDFLCIVLGGADIEDQNYGYIVTNRMLDWIEDNYSLTKVLSPETEVGSIPVTLSALTADIEIRATETLSYFLPSHLELGKDITYSLRLKSGSLEAPVEEGTYVGYVAVMYGSKTLGTAELYTTESAQRHGFIGSMKWLEDLLSNRPIFAAIIFFVVVLVGWIVTEQVIRIRRRHKWDKYFSKKMALSQAEPKKKSQRKTKK